MSAVDHEWPNRTISPGLHPYGNIICILARPPRACEYAVEFENPALEQALPERRACCILELWISRGIVTGTQGSPNTPQAADSLQRPFHSPVGAPGTLGILRPRSSPEVSLGVGCSAVLPMVRMNTLPPDLGEGNCPWSCSSKAGGRWGLMSCSFLKSVSLASGFLAWRLGKLGRTCTLSSHLPGALAHVLFLPVTTVEPQPAPARSRVGPSGPAHGYCLCLSLLGPHGGGGELHQMSKGWQLTGACCSAGGGRAWLCSKTNLG